MTVGRSEDSLDEAWRVEPDDLTKGFLRLPFDGTTAHTYDNATTYVLARIVERVTGRDLREFLDERLFGPMGIEHAEWDRVASGAAFGFHGLHLTTEAIAAFGELLLRRGRWGDQQLVPREWVELATTAHVETRPLPNWPENPDFQSGYGYQFWIARHGYHGHGSWGQYCVVAPEHELVIAFTGTVEQSDVLPGLFWDHLLDDVAEGEERLRALSLAPVAGTREGARAEAEIDGSVGVLPQGTTVTVEPADDGWRVTLGDLQLEVGYREWRESSPLGRPVVATGAWQGDTFVADLYVITTPHRVRLTVGASATATWNVVPLTTPDLRLHLQHPLMTRPDVS
jgi:CubicO group peptidase (beta-lactamase class C family)